MLSKDLVITKKEMQTMIKISEIKEFVDETGTTFVKLDYGNKYEYKFSYVDSVTGDIIYDYCDTQQLYDWNIVVAKIIRQ
jgi:hypothetical protein